MHLYDLASPQLASTATTGKHIKEATLTVSRPGAAKDFLKVTMKDLVITEVLVSGDEDDVSEEVAIQPSWISFDYAEPGHGGGPTGRTSSFTWDIRSNKMG
jgi:type VI protein secretion system component Hcp